VLEHHAFAKKKRTILGAHTIKGSEGMQGGEDESALGENLRGKVAISNTARGVHRWKQEKSSNVRGGRSIPEKISHYEPQYGIERSI